MAIPTTRVSARARAVDTMFLVSTDRLICIGFVALDVTPRHLFRQNAYADAQSELYKCLFGSDESKVGSESDGLPH